ncbi:NfeD family protein [Solwaraspora sp. WMMD406]|uniref:NfeD family protein n=1 Tax=Solwaraspora sp. WMMD406 TaxID=3016095 RepID=UPI0024171C8B|nr:NfeD family protein [Solwaraspora sp. WMMD406]MDG4763069.1 NfeD family protein [Solwaraspora sp. WMMD406]
MDTATLVFLIVGGLGVAVLAVGLLGGEILHFGDVGADGPVSLEMVAGFAGTFGFAAAIANELIGAGSPGLVVAATAIGVTAAVPAGWLTMRLSRAARDMPTDATPTRTDLIGSLGVVITPIHPGGYGEIRVRVGGQPVKLSARANQPIPLGAQVFVVEAPSDTSVVVEQTPPVQ